MNVIVIGSGNTATVLAQVITAAGHTIVQVWSRDFSHAAELAQKVNATAIHSLQEITTNADLCIIAVADQAIQPVAAQLQLKKKVLVHTAGSVNMDVLKNSSPNYGVLYPLQSLRKEMKTVPGIPFLIDGNSDEVKVLLYDFAKQVTGNAAFANDEQRLQLHLSAVIVSNFTNHLYAVTQNYCKQHGLNFELLLPMITEVAGRLQNQQAVDLQTGPARRGDEETIQKHLQLLQQHPALLNIYQQLTQSIKAMYQS